MKKGIRFVNIVLVLCLIAITSEAKINENAGVDAGQFLKIGVGPRACGMGEAFCAVADDVYALYYNPAGLSQLQQKEISFMHNKWLKDLRYEFLGYAKPVGLGVFGASLTYLGMDDLIGRDKDGIYTGMFEADDFAIQLAYSLMANSDLSVGASLKLIREKIESERSSAIVLDIGLLRQEQLLENPFDFAFVIKNIDTKLKFINEQEDLPIIYKAGVSYKIYENKLILAADLTKPMDNDLGLNLGTEYLMTPDLTLRCGYNSKNDLDNGFSFGAGFKFPALYLNYAYVPYGKLGNTHRISVVE